MSLRLKTILGVAAIEAVLLTLLVWMGLNYISESNQREFTQRAIATVKSFAVTSKDAVLSTDLASLESFVTEVMKYPGVVYARVRDVDGRVLADDGDPRYLQRPFRADSDVRSVRDEVFDAFAEIEEADTLFGRVELGLSVQALRTVLAEARHYGTMLALLEMILVALFSSALGLYLTRQLSRLTRASERIAAGDLGYQVEIGGQDELARTARAFNLMSARVQTSYNQLAEREQDLRAILNHIQEGILTTDDRGIIQSASSAACSIFAREASALHGYAVHDLLVNTDAAGWSDPFDGDPFGPLGRTQETRGLLPDGSEFPIEITFTAMQRGDARHFVVVIRNISERKQTENALRVAKEAAEQAAEAKTQFLANMSHEIRTPMQGVLGALEMLADTPLTAAQARYTETASVSAEVLLSVIDEILEFSRLEAGKLRIESIEFDLRKSVEDVVAMLGQRAHAKHLELACFIDPEVPLLLRGDPMRLRQILINLVGNAIKFTEQGEVVVNVTVGARTDQRLRLALQVQDTGIGIAKDKQARLFDAFVQADGSTSRQYGGTGLGLSICKRLVELMHGEIGVESEPNQGARFWFELPFDTAFQRVTDRSVDFRGKRILIVDDNATNRIILHRYLTAWRVQPGSAADGEEGLSAIQDAATAGHPYHLVLLDLNMPGMDGRTLVKALRSDPQLAPTRVIMLSSSGSDEEASAGLGVDVWMTKPVRQSDLQDAISTVLHDHPTEPGPPEWTSSGTLPFAGERVLLVEDNPVSRDLGAAMLSRRGLSVDLASTGEEALAAVQHSGYDLVLMDVQMPQMDGYEATRRLREKELVRGSGRLPVIALTAHALPSDRQKCLDAGMDDYLVKPYNVDSLSTLIARWLSPPGPVGPSPSTASPVLDQTKIEEIRRIMGPRFNDLLAKFADSVHSQLTSIRDEGHKGNREAAFEAAHSLKNTAGELGARSLHLAAQAIERSMHSGDDWHKLIPELEAIATAAIGAAQTIIDREIQ